MTKILLVDDDQNLVASLKDLLIAENYEIETAYLGKDGLQLLQNFAFDPIIARFVQIEERSLFCDDLVGQSAVGGADVGNFCVAAGQGRFF